ncbi:Uncharacterised protein [Citrobacter koseri]|uniref:Uncharacterized protein n=1 Tax=Citrobacter koseri TaxID=545 RepID=A0A2X2WHU4_CITKO|nr:Uncharacterised protein [Citrobacter koseri]
MQRKIMVVTAAYGYDQVRAAGGQTAMPAHHCRSGGGWRRDSP